MRSDSIRIDSEECRFDTSSETTTIGVGDMPPVPSGPKSAAQAPTKRRPGRPQGSKNKLSKDARVLLASKGLAGIKALCDIAAGRTIYRPLRGGKGREALTPSLDQMIAAQRILVSRLVPELRAVEAVVDANVRHDDAPQYSTRQTARAILNLLGPDVQLVETPTPRESDLLIDNERL
jgi:hypothetical protein